MFHSPTYVPARWGVAAAVFAAATFAVGCRAPIPPDATSRLNLPSSFEPLQNAPKRYRPTHVIDPDYLRHPARWHKRLKARYA